MSDSEQQSLSRITAPKVSLFLFSAVLSAGIAAVLLDPLAVGRRDLIAYWSAAQLLFANGNPYSPSELQNVQSLVPSSPDLYMPFRSPPWVLVLLAPILSLPWGICARVFFGLSVLSLWFFGRNILRISHRPFNARTFVALFAVHQPILACLYWGQIGIIQACAASHLLLRNRGQISTAAALLILSCKPHPLLLFLLIWLIVSEIRNEWRALVTTGVFLLLLSGCALAFNPHIFLKWAHSFSVLEPYALIKPTIVDWVRLLFLNGQYGKELSLAFLALGSLGILAASRWLRAHPEQALILGIPLSFLTAPYIWHHDFVLLGASAATVVSSSVGLIALLALGIGELIASACGAPPHVYLFIPIAILLLVLRTGPSDK